MTRRVLPHRRRNETVGLEHQGQHLTVTVGFDDDGHAREVFADGARLGSDLAHVIADACVVMSLALQHDCAAPDLVKSLSVTPDLARGEDATRPASVLGAIAAAVAVAGPRGRSPEAFAAGPSPSPRPSGSAAARPETAA
ncbi:hypothetical protein [uncultured Albimonas sp.]|uniref:TSCPD domain-containing protein n=1 Tax=uncultured Albimonas sp. TaxID=1331701 RepID=UPI0030EF0570